MKILRLLIVVAVISLCSCKGTGEKADGTAAADSVASMKMITDSNIVTAALDSQATSNQQDSNNAMQATQHNANNSLDWAGSYKGTVPCADCEGIETTVVLNQNGTFKKITRYLGKKVSTASEANGNFSWIDASNIKLEGLANEANSYFVAENKIIQLDGEGKRITGALASKYILEKTK